MNERVAFCIVNNLILSEELVSNDEKNLPFNIFSHYLDIVLFLKNFQTK